MLDYEQVPRKMHNNFCQKCGYFLNNAAFLVSQQVNWMNKENSRSGKFSLPFDTTVFEEHFGEIYDAEQRCPGVYYLSTRKGRLIAPEYFIVMDDAPAISQEARRYGFTIPDLPGLCLFAYTGQNDGWKVIEYETNVYRFSHGLSPEGIGDLHEIAFWGMEDYPEYFGEYPVPMITPEGYTTRHKRIDNGVYWLESDRCRRFLAVSSPVCCDLSDFSQKLGIQLTSDLEKHYRFFAQEICCIPLFDLLAFHSWDAVIDRAALMNVIWRDFPEYAAVYNMAEQTDWHDPLGFLLESLEQESSVSPDKMISISPEAGTKFFRF